MALDKINKSILNAIPWPFHSNTFCFLNCDFILVALVPVWHNTECHCWTFIFCYWAMLKLEGVDSVPQNTNSRSSTAYRWFGSQLWNVQSTHMSGWLSASHTSVMQIIGTDASSHFAVPGGRCRRGQCHLGAVWVPLALDATSRRGLVGLHL